ncbi:MAG: PQQ-dependent sugar dehydrogenase [Candidatus Neomarinimicrobiota bacterium]|nr:PQQ-dependent sugar dehydrogenase [Candidatus Neomarinimicrobiota bacterium]
MRSYKKIMSVLIFTLIINNINANYEIIDAFPNLSFTDPVDIYHPNDNSNRLFVIEQPGKIMVFQNDPLTAAAETFLDIRSIVDQDPGYTEEGLLGFAFHPNFNENGYFYVNYTDYGPKRNVIARYTVSNNNPNQADESSSLIILEVNQPYTNHNGGQMGFGPNDGFLYISFGDGGSAGDPLGHGQNLQTLLGTIVRIDVNNPSNGNNYGIPIDNPFQASIDGLDEIYAYGLRNMWKFSWDDVTGFLWGADVGQYEWEEIDIIEPGLNYGWNTMEGNHCYPAGTNCNTEGLEPPIYEYPLYVNGVCSITGGYVYRGNQIPSLHGKYIYGDWCTGDIWALTYDGVNSTLNEDVLSTGLNITSFGIDQDNELLICANSKIFKLISDESPMILGDLNQDLIINVQDVILLINIILGQTPNDQQIWAGDMNSDETIDILDVVLLVNRILN